MRATISYKGVILKQFKSKIDGSSIHIYQNSGVFYVKRTRKGQQIAKVEPICGPFKDEGQALLAVCMSKEIGFNNFRQVYP